MPQNTCPCCSKTFNVEPARAKYRRGKYCSRTCQYAHQWKDRSDLTAATINVCECGAEFRYLDSQVRGKKGAGKYCSRVCRDKYRVGAAIPNYRGGSDKTYTRGSNWGAQRRAALRRDGKNCQHCGRSGDDMQVHHITPFRLFDDYREANKLKNLLVLCPPCHRKADAVIQKAGL